MQDAISWFRCAVHGWRIAFYDAVKHVRCAGNIAGDCAGDLGPDFVSAVIQVGHIPRHNSVDGAIDIINLQQIRIGDGQKIDPGVIAAAGTGASARVVNFCGKGFNSLK